MRTGDRIACRTFGSHRTTARFFTDFEKYLNNYDAPFANGTGVTKRPYPEHISLPSPSSPPSAETSRRRKERRRQRSRFLPAMAKTSVRHARTPHRGDAHNAWLTPHHGEAFPSRHSAMRRSRLCPLHSVTRREIPRRAYPLLGMTRRIEQHFSHVGTSPRRSLFAASSKPFRKRAILLASEIAQRTGTCPRYIQQKNPSAGLGFLLLFSLT